jgi:alpha-tubulin suppressor-like RCC1 family protein
MRCNAYECLKQVGLNMSIFQFSVKGACLLVAAIALLLGGCGGGGSTPSPVVEVAPVFKAQKISAGNGVSLLTKPDGSAWAFGLGSFAQLGNDALVDVAVPGPVLGLSEVAEVAAAENSSMALRSDGSVWVWGLNEDGTLGANTKDVCAAPGSTTSYACTKTPLPVTNLNAVRAIAAGPGYKAVAKLDGSVWGWGSWTGGMFDNGVSSSVSKSPQAVAGLAGIRSISVGSGHALALDANGETWAWGYNLYGQLGTSVVGAPIPQKVVGLSRVKAVAAGGYQSIALKEDGSVWVWGIYGVGSYTWVVTDIGLSGVVSVAAGKDHALVLKADGTVWGWGKNSYGQVGVGGTSDVLVPTQISGLSDVMAISAGTQHSLAVKRDGSVWVWGSVLEASVAASDKCTFTYVDTHGTNPTGQTFTYVYPCAKRPMALKAQS